MKTSVFYSKLNSKIIEENINKHFGVKVNVSPYSREQLEDIRNKLRTKIFNHENGSRFNDLLNNESYQKDKAMLDLVNTRIKEMLGENSKLKNTSKIAEGRKAKEKMANKDYDGDGKIETNKDEVWGSRAKAAAKSGKPFKEEAKKSEPKPEKKETSWTDKSGKKHSATRVKGKGYGNKTDESTNEAADKKETTWTDKSGKTHGATRVKGKNYTGKEADKKEKKANEDAVSEKAVSKKQQKFMGMVHAAKKGGKPASPKVAKVAKSMTDKEAEKFASTKHKGLPEKKKKKVKESLYPAYVKMVNENIKRLLKEDEEERANVITAAGDMANDYTSWMQKVGQYQTKVMIELSDEIRHNFGAQQAELFKQSVGPALAATLETLNSQREIISKAIATLAGEEAPEVPMGQEPGEEIMPSSPDMMNPSSEEMGDEFAASDAASGEGDTGRELRESNYRKKLRESHILLTKLAQ